MKEYFDIVDENDHIIGKAPREECHSNPNLIHRAVYILVFNSKGQLLLQKRSQHKDLDASKWTASASGHVDLGETYENAAARELEEELGIKEKIEFMFALDIYSKQQKMKAKVYKLRSNGPFKINPKEIEEIKFFSLDELKQIIKTRKDIFTHGFLKVLDEVLEK